MPAGPNDGAMASRDACIGVATSFTIFSILIVGVRVVTRAAWVHNAGNDDYAMLAALTFVIGYLICIWQLRSEGMGLSGGDLTNDQMVAQIKTTLAIEIIYYFTIFFIKLSICLCYLRIAAVKSFEALTKYTICFLTVFCGVCNICTLAQCVPLRKMWDFTGAVDGTCIKTTALFYTTSSLNILTDLWILFLPIRTLLKIQRPRHEKLALIIVFSLGVFSCIASIVRLHSIRIYTESSDPFHDSIPINLWSMIEVNIGIWCASIPALKALITLVQRKGTTANSAYQYHGGGKSGGKAASGSRPSVDEVVRLGVLTSASEDDYNITLHEAEESGMARIEEEPAQRAARMSDELTVQSQDQMDRKKSNGGESSWSGADSERGICGSSNV